MGEKETKEVNGTNEKKLRIEYGTVIILILMVYDFLAVAGSYFAALWIRFDCKFDKIEAGYLTAYYHTIFIYAGFCVVVFWALRLYKSIWRFASYSELIRVITATAITGLIHIIAMNGFIKRMPISYFLFGIVIQFGMTLVIRFAYRFVLLLRGRNEVKTGTEKRVMLIGAGRGGQMILRDIKGSKETILGYSYQSLCTSQLNDWAGNWMDGNIRFTPTYKDIP